MFVEPSGRPGDEWAGPLWLYKVLNMGQPAGTVILTPLAKPIEGDGNDRLAHHRESPV